MKQLNDPISIISFRGDKNASAANSMKDTQARHYLDVGTGNATDNRQTKRQHTRNRISSKKSTTKQFPRQRRIYKLASNAGPTPLRRYQR